jgi:hypothetical protein
VSNRLNRRAAISQARKRASWEWQERDPRDYPMQDLPALARMRLAFVNDFYIVQAYDVATELGAMHHLAIRAVNGSEPPWRDLQRIKNELVGEEREAVQVYPKTSDVTDVAPMYHLFVLPEAWPIPFGLHRECGFVPQRRSL